VLVDCKLRKLATSRTGDDNSGRVLQIPGVYLNIITISKRHRCFINVVLKSEQGGCINNLAGEVLEYY